VERIIPVRPLERAAIKVLAVLRMSAGIQEVRRQRAALLKLEGV